jgi:homoserine kinase type II
MMATAKWMSAATIWIKAATSICGKYWNGSSLTGVCLYSNNPPAIRSILFNNKPAAVFKRLSGIATTSPSFEQCQEIGVQLANIHRCTQDYVFPIKNNNNPDWRKTVLHKIDAQLSATDRALINDELLFQAASTSVNLPHGFIHADLFRDNVLFVDNQLSGILDFYSACTGALLFDIAITANDWCCENGDINPDKFTALLSAYESLRPLEQLEKQHWQTMLRAAALRFWLSRLEHQLYPRPGDIIQQKDPLIFRQLLKQHRQQNIANLSQTKALPSCFQPAANSCRQINSGGSRYDTDYKMSF